MVAAGSPPALWCLCLPRGFPDGTAPFPVEWKGESGAERGAAVPGSLPALEWRDRGSSGGVTNCKDRVLSENRWSGAPPVVQNRTYIHLGGGLVSRLVSLMSWGAWLTTEKQLANVE